MPQATLRKVLRWAVSSCAYNYTCIHIPGPNNVCADIINCFITPPVVQRLVSVPVLPSSFADDFSWPRHGKQVATQTALDALRLTIVSKDPDGLARTISVPFGFMTCPNNFQLRLCVIALTGSSGHRDATTTERALHQHYFWSTISAEIKTFVHSCIHCLLTVRGGKIAHPFGPAVYGTALNDLL